MHGTNTSTIEITNISKHGIWLFRDDEEYFLSYEDFPWFKNAIISEIFEIEEISPGHLYWPKLDIDLGIETIKRPEKYPLLSKVTRKL